MSYEETIQYLYHHLPMYQQVGQSALKNDLDNITALSLALENPHLAYQTIHVAGTNGKGSTAHMVAAILQANGLKVGLYTSPHYRDFRERIKINGAYISKKAVIDFVENHKNTIEKIQPSYFEMTVAMAFDHFRNEKVDMAVIETGLGGRDDSTNIIQPILSIITNVSYDHTRILGNTLGEIATIKSGIVKPNVPVLIGERHEETEDIFIKKAQKTTSSIGFAEDIYRAEVISQDFRKTIFNIFNKNNELVFKDLELQLFGNYQSKNVITALAATLFLNNFTQLKISTQNIIYGLQHIKSLTNMIGRWDILKEKPLILADSGHNEAGIKNVVEQLKAIPCKQLRIVLGMVKDKDLDKMLSLLPQRAVYYFVKPNVARGLNSKILQEKAFAKGLKGVDCQNVSAGLQRAVEEASFDDLIFVGGSSFVVGEVVDVEF